MSSPTTNTSKQKRQVRDKAWRLKRKLLGLCIGCSNKSKPNKVRCQRCVDEKRLLRALYRSNGIKVQ